MNASLSLATAPAPAVGAAGPEAAPARDTGAEGFSDALSTILGAGPLAAAPGKQTPVGPGPKETNGTGPVTDPAGVDPASAAQGAMAIFPLPITPSPVPIVALALPEPKADAAGTGTGTGPTIHPARAEVSTLGGPWDSVAAAPFQAALSATAPQTAAPQRVPAVPTSAGPVPPEARPVATEPPKVGKQAAAEPAAAPLTVPAPATTFAVAPTRGQPASAPQTAAAAAPGLGAPGGEAPAPAPASAAAPALAPVPTADTAYVPGTPPLASVPAASSTGPAAPAPPVPVPPGFAAQLARPVFTLAAAGTGEHTMVVAVHPDHLGPVTLQAHISAAGVRVELFAANADGREVLRQILPDLKRDLAGSGLNASLDLSSGNQPGGGQDAREQTFNRRAAIAFPHRTDSRQLPLNSPASGAAASLYGADGSLDVMA